MEWGSSPTHVQSVHQTEQTVAMIPVQMSDENVVDVIHTDGGAHELMLSSFTAVNKRDTAT